VRVVGKLAGVVAGAGLIVLVSAQPAAAHSVPGIQPSNYQTTVKSITPRVPALVVQAIDLGNKLELRNDTGGDVIVLGYQGEPYLRIGPRGVFENRRSAATYLNRTRNGKTPVPSSTDPSATPQWRKTATGTTARWHDHRAHWMGTDDPPEVARHPGRRHVIDRWQLQLRRGSQDVTVRGDLVWVPAPSPWGWVLGALAAAVAMVALSRTRPWRWVVAGALTVLAVSEPAHVAGTWTATSASVATKIGASIYAVGGIALVFVALVWIVIRPPYNAMPAVLFAGLVVAFAGGVADISALTHSQLPTNLPGDVARLLVALAIGLGAGLAAAAALRLRPPSRPPVVRPPDLPLRAESGSRAETAAR
jgi:hypothetical protein